MDIQEILNALRLDQQFTNNVAAWERLPARPARYGEFPSQLDRRLIALTRQLDRAPLFTHQVAAIESVLAGKHVVMATGTASGKSLAYQLPTLQAMLRDPSATALYLFPTKALAQDQARSLAGIIKALETDDPIRVNVYDGDTPSGRRTQIRRQGGIVISNPDMLHVGVLPYHSRWVGFFLNLRYVILDELHTYRGVFGSHMANVLRRLRRICQFYGSDPIFICASATIANPADLAERLIGSPVIVVDEDGAPQGEKHIIIYNPPTIDEDLGIRRSYTLESRLIASRFITEKIQTIIFARARLTTEVLLGYVRDEVQRYGIKPESIRGYRGGYLPTLRREIEAGLQSGEVQGVVTTNALELGVDIGALGAAILAGYPGTIASTWQQFGRSGRRSDVSVGIMVTSGAPLDQYIAMHPRYLFESPPEHALINPDNLAILIDHLHCALYELPFEPGEGFGSFEDAGEVLGLLAEDSESIHASGDSYHWVSDIYPAADVNLRTSTDDTIVIQTAGGDDPIVIGEVDRQQAPISVYEGAIYLHEGRQFVIKELDWESGIAHAAETSVDYYTTASSSTTVEVEDEVETSVVADCVKAYGRVLVTSEAAGFRRIKRYTHETLSYGEIILPPQEFETTAYWVSLTPDLTSRLEAAEILLRPNNYGANWQEQRNKARQRDNYRCTRCEAPEKPERQHDVHHIRPFREFSYILGENENYRHANQLDNLRTLCRSCHHTIERIQGTRSALSGIRNVLHNVATLYLMCSPNDIGVLAEQRSKDTRSPTITVYDHAPGGLGLSDRLYDLHDQLFKSTLELVADCPCSQGCPVCVGPVGEVGVHTKELSIKLLEAIIEDTTF